MPKSNSQQRGALTPAPAASKRGRSGEEPAVLLRVRTGQKALRAVGGRLLAKKLTGWNTPPQFAKQRG